jgi:nitrogen fixation NifU-like protein
MELDSLYQEVILDHYKHPLNKGLSETYGAQVHHVNPSCGDEITLNISAKDGVISSITWDGVGCSISQASVSIASDLLVNKSFKDADSILQEFTELMQSKGTKEEIQMFWKMPLRWQAFPSSQHALNAPYWGGWPLRMQRLELRLQIGESNHGYKR